MMWCINIMIMLAYNVCVIISVDYHEFGFRFILPPSLWVKGRGFWEIRDVLRNGPDWDQAILAASERHSNTWNPPQRRRVQSETFEGLSVDLHGQHAEGLWAAAGQAAPGDAVNQCGVSQTLQAAPAGPWARARVRVRVRAGPQLDRLLFGAGQQDPAGRTPFHAGDGLLMGRQTQFRVTAKTTHTLLWGDTVYLVGIDDHDGVFL